MISEEEYKKHRVAIVIARSVKKNPFQAEALPSEMAEGNVENGFGMGKVDLLHVDEAKGVEYDKVYAVLKGMSRAEIYIACTRALSELIVVEEG